MSTKKIVRLVEPVNMGLSHDGLKLLCKNLLKLNLEKLAKDDLVLFVNRARDRMKVVGKGGSVIGYLRVEKGQRIRMEALQYIPQTFGAEGMNYDAALKKSIEEALARRE